jgi:hypothetical protein
MDYPCVLQQLDVSLHRRDGQLELCGELAHAFQRLFFA